MKPHKIAQLVNDLKDIAIKYHDKKSLREVISRRVNDSLSSDKNGFFYYANPVNTFDCDLYKDGFQPKGWIKIDEYGEEELK